MGVSAVRAFARHTTALLVFSLAMTPKAGADTAYVTDKLRLGVHEAADTSDKAFESLQSGDAVEVLERNRFYARVRLEDGREGWVRAAYLESKEPARRRVLTLEKERDELNARLAAAEAAAAERAGRITEMEREQEAGRRRTEAGQEELGRLRLANAQLESKLAAYRFSVGGFWVVVLAGAAFTVGFTLAWWWLDRRSRKRHGGFRIY